MSDLNYEITNFQTDVIERSKTIPVLVDFWAEWCGPCKTLGPVLEKLAAEHTGRWVLAKVDTEKHQDLAREYGVRSIPNVKLFIDGAVVNEFSGAIPERQILQWLEKVLPNKFKKEIDAARTVLIQNNSAAAIEILEKVLSADKANEEAIVLLARSYVTTDLKKAVSLVNAIEEYSEFFSTVEAIRAFAMMAETLAAAATLPKSPARAPYLEGLKSIVTSQFDRGVTSMIETIRADRYYNDDAARKACVAVFQYLGEEHEVTIKHRRDFGSALYT
jgi:putative thioredoxin